MSDGREAEPHVLRDGRTRRAQMFNEQIEEMVQSYNNDGSWKCVENVRTRFRVTQRLKLI